MKVRLGRLVALTIVCAAFVSAVSAPGASAATCAKITGSGSSLQANAQSLWDGVFNAFTTKTQYKPTECTTPTKLVTYVATSSGRGLNCWGALKVTEEFETTECGTSGTLDAFIGTDVAPEGPAGTAGTQLFNIDHAGKTGGAPNEVMAVPVAQSAIAIVVTLPVGCTPELTKGVEGILKNTSLEEQWNSNTGTLSGSITGLGTFSGCGTKPPSLIVRSKNSGTTAGFKRGLNQINTKHWSKFVETPAVAENTTWPATTLKISSTGKEEAENVSKTANSIGYADLADARSAGLTRSPKLHKLTGGAEEAYSFFVRVEVGAGKISPEAEVEEGSNCALALYNEPASVAPNVDWSGASQTNDTGGKAYPFCTLTFKLAWKHYSGLTPAYTAGTENSVLDLFHYVVNDAQEGTAAKALELKHYWPLVEPMLAHARTGVSATNIGV